MTKFMKSYNAETIIIDEVIAKFSDLWKVNRICYPMIGIDADKCYYAITSVEPYLYIPRNVGEMYI